MKYQLHRIEKKTLSMKGLITIVRQLFDKIPSEVKPKKISLSDCLMSALAKFSLKSPSLPAFDGQKASEMVVHNLKTLCEIDDILSDTRMREVLDEVAPKFIRECFLSVFHVAQRGKLLEEYEFHGSYLCLVDGTEIFNSEKIHCNNCCKKEHKDGRVTYHHQILGAAIAHSNRSQVSL